LRTAYGVRADEEEDEAADAAARETANAMAEGSLPPFFGIRIKPLNEAWKRRGVRTLLRFLMDYIQNRAVEDQKISL